MLSTSKSTCKSMSRYLKKLHFGLNIIANQCDCFDFHAPVERQFGHLNASACRKIVRKHELVFLVDGAEFSQIDDVHRALEHSINARTGSVQNSLQILQSFACLRSNAAGHQSLGVLVQTETAGQINGAVGNDCLAGKLFVFLYNGSDLV